MSKPDPLAVAIYARCSTDDQEESVAVQLEMCRDYCRAQNYVVVAEYSDDGVTGGLECDRRPGASAMLRDARVKPRPFDAIVCRSNRRLGRDNIDLLVMRREAKRARLKLLFVTQQFEDSATGDFLWAVLAASAEMDRKLTGERVVAHNRHRCKTGRWPCGQPPLGYTWDKEEKALRIDTARQADAIAVFEAFIRHAGNRRATVRHLNENGILSRDGGPWHNATLSRYITNPLHRGLLAYQDLAIPSDEIPEVVPRQLVESAYRLYQATVGKTLRIGAKHTYAYAAMIRCAECGRRYVGHPRNGKPEYYICTGRYYAGTCGAPGIGIGRLDRLFGQALQVLLRSYAERLIAESKRLDQAESTRRKPSPHNTRRDIIADRRKWLDLFDRGIISQEELEERLSALDAANTRPACGELGVQLPVLDLGLEREMIRHFARHWPEWTALEKRQLLLQVVDIAVLRSARPGILTIHSALGERPVEVRED